MQDGAPRAISCHASPVPSQISPLQKTRVFVATLLANDVMSESVLRLAVCGLHLKGQPLHSQLTDLHAVFIRSCFSVRDWPQIILTYKPSGLARWPPPLLQAMLQHHVQHLTRPVGVAQQAEKYRLYAVGPPLTAPTKPGMIKMTQGSCIKVPMELYDLPMTNVGAFISKVRRHTVLQKSHQHARRTAICGTVP